MPDWIFQLVTSLIVAGAMYGAMKQDLKNLHEKVGGAQAAAARAHDRIDGMLINGGKHG